MTGSRGTENGYRCLIACWKRGAGAGDGGGVGGGAYLWWGFDQRL